MMVLAHPPHAVPPHSSWGGGPHQQLETSMEEDELQDICDHVQLHSSQMIPTVEARPNVPKEVQSPPPPSSVQEQEDQERQEQEQVSSPQDNENGADDDDDDDDDDTPLSEDQARFCAVKREAILLLSGAHKSCSGAERIKAMTLLGALYKAETKHDLAVLGEKIQELLQQKREQDEETLRQKQEEANNRTPERFSRIRSGLTRMMQPNSSDVASVASQPCPRRNARQDNNNNGRGWRFFWQRGDANEGRRRQRHSHDGIHGLQVATASANAGRNARMQSLSERRKIWDTRTI